MFTRGYCIDISLIQFRFILHQHPVKNPVQIPWEWRSANFWFNKSSLKFGKYIPLRFPLVFTLHLPTKMAYLFFSATKRTGILRLRVMQLLQSKQSQMPQAGLGFFVGDLSSSQNRILPKKCDWAFFLPKTIALLHRCIFLICISKQHGISD